MKIFLPLLFFIFSSCYNQNNTTLTFVNNSSFQVDSIVIRENKNHNLGPLRAGQQYSKYFPEIKINTNNEGIFSFIAFLNGKIRFGTWGFHDFGTLSSKEEVFYIFDNGISRTNTPLVKPTEFKLFFYNASPKNIDTILSSNNAILKVNELSPRSLEIIYNYNKIEESQEFIAILSGSKMNFKIDFHDFSNWDNNQDFLHFENNKLQSGALEWKEPLEFQVDIQINIPLSADSVIIESTAITMTYNFTQPKYKKIVFDFKKLKQNPIFIVIAGGKKYQVDLSSHDFSNKYYNQKIFYLEEKGIRSLSE